MSYRKRDIGHWNQGKSYKGSRKAKEKEYGKKEIDLQMAEQDPEFRYRHYSHTKNEIESLKGQIQHYEHLYETYKREGKDRSWDRGWTNYWKDCAKKARKKLKELESEKDLHKMSDSKGS